MLELVRVAICYTPAVRRRRLSLLPLLLTCLYGGCGPTPEQRAEAEALHPTRESNTDAHGGFAHYFRRILLTAEAPRDDIRGIQLLRIEEDGAAVIHVDETGETLSARPGEYYLGRYGGPYNKRTFGEQGLRLATSDPAAQTAVLIQVWADYGPPPEEVPGARH